MSCSSLQALDGAINRMYKILGFWIASTAVAWAAVPSDLGFVPASSLPRALNQYLLRSSGHEAYTLTDRLNPFYLQADFNGDGRMDTAVLVQEKATGKQGILIAHIGANEHYVLGAGNAIGNGGDDFSWLGAWQVYPQGEVAQSPHVDAAPPTLRGDALLVFALEASSGIIYWTGTEYDWYQQGD